MGGQNSDTISKLGLDQALCRQTGETQRRATRAESWVVGLEPSWPGTILSIGLASPVGRPGPLLHAAKQSAALGGQSNPGLFSPRPVLLSLGLTLALQLGSPSVMYLDSARDWHQCRGAVAAGAKGRNHRASPLRFSTHSEVLVLLPRAHSLPQGLPRGPHRLLGRASVCPCSGRV